MVTRFGVLGEERTVVEALAFALDSFDGLESVGVATRIADVVELALSRRPDALLVGYQVRDGRIGDCIAALREQRVNPRLILLTAHRVLPTHLIKDGIEQVLSSDSRLEAVANAVQVRPAVLASTEAESGGQKFSRRQREVLDLMGQGYDPSDIAEALSISIHTARSHVKSVMMLLESPTQLAAVITALRQGYLLPPTP